MTGPGLAALPEGGRVDFTRLRTDRRRRLLAAMAHAGLDVLALGRPANIAFATGARQLWTAGSRPFSPACLVVAADERIHLLATWDEGVPDDIPREQLFGLSWNPGIATAHVAAVPGLAGARRVGADGTSPSWRRLLAEVAPDAEVVDAGPLLAGLRAVKSADEVAAIETACALAEGALEAMAGALAPGVTTRQLLAVHAERLGRLGAPIVPNESVAQATTHGHRSVVDDVPLQHGDLVALSPSASYAGHEGTLARTVPVGGALTPAQADLGAACRSALDAAVGACRAGATGAALLEAWESAGGGPMPGPLVVGVGLGAEQPIVGMGVGADAELRPGMALAVQGWVERDGVGGWLERDVVVVTDGVPRTLTRWPSGDLTPASGLGSGHGASS
ncbi:MAG TPA: M24 family metallopeptidase [Acidimicrobiales bacterium]|nr:M24 family metallopeptidase [Acidimicrobiales bacterium]